MQTTSHFIGAKMEPSVFIDLFVDMYQYLKNNNVRDCLEFYNPLSVHITLYYLDSDISEQKNQIEKWILDINKEILNTKIFIDSVSFFENEGKETMGYLHTLNFTWLQKTNSQLSKLFPNSVKDNTQTYVPHLSLFKIKNHQVFSEHKTSILQIIDRHLQVIKKHNSFKSISLYSVNSNFKPEIQIEMGQST